MSLMKDLLERPFDQAITSKYTAMNGLIYLGFVVLALVGPEWCRRSSGTRLPFWDGNETWPAALGNGGVHAARISSRFGFVNPRLLNEGCTPWLECHYR